MKMILISKSNNPLLRGLLIFIALGLFFTTDVSSELSNTHIIQAVMCESIKNHRPINPAVVFSISLGEIYCFSNFDPVIKTSYISHKWYKKDKLIFTIQLPLYPPKWSTFSRIQFRDADKGPWRVEIRKADNTLLKTLRFSMVD
ncbi:MAG: DUF2914 domain-containing protein [Desulfobacteraceae bacterium]|nr:DUF2914 domain-containing protein [Desulfobacteraceae bacterium]